MDYYKQQIEQTNKEINILNGKNNLFHTTRLISFALIFIFLFIANSYFTFFIVFSFLSLIAFVLIVMKHNKHESVLRSYKNKITVLKNYEYRINNQFHTFSNNGTRYLEEDKFYLSDLDIFGEASLFQLINVCETKMGQDILASRLKCSDKTYLNDVLSVEELKDKLEFSVNFQSNMYAYSKDSTKVSLESSLETLKLKPSVNIVSDVVLPIALVLVTIVCIIFSIITSDISYILGAVIVNFVIGLSYSMIRKEQFNNIKEVVSSLSPLAQNFELISKEEFKTESLINTKESLISGYQSMINLQKIETLVTLQDNLLSSMFINLFIPFNILVYLRYVNFHKKSNVDIENSIKEYTNLESLLSLAIIPQIKKEVCKPTLNDKLNISFKGIKHPLIKEEVCVENDMNITPSINIITGSNMSGKTSFLRTIGINLVLMYAGGMVNSKEFNADTINIYSSMRITDDIKNGISTFYRELLRIKSAIKDAHDNVKSIILVDEVFRGTNSNDRIQGAISLINHLKLPNVILFMTTHDFELCKVDNVLNYHFEEHYEDDKIAFDYKLKEGQCTTTNAVYLMRLAGIMK